MKELIKGNIKFSYGLSRTNWTHFSLMYAEYNNEQLIGEIISGGCGDLEFYEKHAPELLELRHWHLCDDKGIPMHYVANAIYWAELASGKSKWQDSTNVPHGYDSFYDVLEEHVLTNVLGDQDELKQVYGSNHALELWLNGRKDKLTQKFNETMKRFNISFEVEEEVEV